MSKKKAGPDGTGFLIFGSGGALSILADLYADPFPLIA